MSIAAAAGSSPRGRGTPLLAVGHAHVDRFIPAWAGNTNIQHQLVTIVPVHPRVGGEHRMMPDSNISNTGSSPRGRGTLSFSSIAGPPRRFIPAWAGNTAARSDRAGRVPVHPRVGGEHVGEIDLRGDYTGSSPRGRGTPLMHEADGVIQRFIPAWAGNTGPPTERCSRTPVHPRVGGEHVRARPQTRYHPGSSPRGRGTPRLYALAEPLGRFIPAWAGNTAAA